MFIETILSAYARSHSRSRSLALTHSRTLARTHARTHSRTHTHTHTHTHIVVYSLTSIQEERGKRFQSFTGQIPRHSTRQRRQSNQSFVFEHIETTASVKKNKKTSNNTQTVCFFLFSSHKTVNKIHCITNLGIWTQIKLIFWI